MTVLVTGAAGLLGASVAITATEAGYAVNAVGSRHRLVAPQVDFTTADLSVPGVATELFYRLRPRFVIHTAAATDVDACERDPQFAHRMNETMAAEVASASRAVGARLIHISTEAVYSGSDGPYDKSSAPAPVNVYGASKLAGDRAVIGLYPDTTVVRTTIYGWNALPKASLAEWFLQRFREGRRAPGFEDVWMSPILVNDLADRLLSIMEQAHPGILHVTGRDCLSKAGFGRIVAKTFGFDPDLVEPTSVADAGLVASRARRPCLRVGRAEAWLGPMPSVAQGLDRFLALEKSGYPSRLKAYVEGA